MVRCKATVPPGWQATTDPEVPLAVDQQVTQAMVDAITIHEHAAPLGQVA
jgi:hypothetical protein